MTLYAWPHVLLPEFSVAYGEPEYRNALCAQIGEKVVQASLEEGDALTIEFENGTVFGFRCGKKMWMGRRLGVIRRLAKRVMRRSFRDDGQEVCRNAEKGNDAR